MGEKSTTRECLWYLQLCSCRLLLAALRAGGDGDEAARAAVAKAQADEATQEIMKQLNFPEVEKTSKAPQVAPKIPKCLQKRISKLQECQNKFVGELNQNQTMRLVIDSFGIRNSI